MARLHARFHASISVVDYFDGELTDNRDGCGRERLKTLHFAE